MTPRIIVPIQQPPVREPANAVPPNLDTGLVAQVLARGAARQPQNIHESLGAIAQAIALRRVQERQRDADQARATALAQALPRNDFATAMAIDPELGLARRR
jgi:hypothetical protein